jgi:hypothetical protein
MSRHYFSWEEDEANKLGHQDERNHRSDYTHSKYAYDGEDRAYWDGREDEAKEEKRREEEREEEERQEREEQERHQRRIEAQREQERQQEEDYQRQRYEDDMRERDAEQRREEESWKELERECATEEYLNEVPSTEQELFNQILEDERSDQEPQSDSN